MQSHSGTAFPHHWTTPPIGWVFWSLSLTVFATLLRIVTTTSIGTLEVTATPVFGAERAEPALMTEVKAEAPTPLATPDDELWVAIDGLVTAMRELARDIDGTDPEAPVDIQFHDGTDKEPPCTSACTWSDGTIEIYQELSEERIVIAIIHEVAHALTWGDSHGETWCRLFETGIDALTETKVAYRTCRRTRPSRRRLSSIL
jgi:hypothetical protein